MTNQQVIEAVLSDNTNNCTSTSLRWYGRNKTLLYLDKKCDSKDTNKWKIGMLFFDGVMFYNKEFGKHSSRYSDTNKYDNIVSKYMANGNLCVLMHCLDMVEVNTRKLKSNWDYLTEYIRKSIPVQDFDLYWTWVWQYPLTAFAKQINDYHITVEGSMTEISYSEQFNSMKQVLNIFNDVDVNGDINSKVDTFRSMLENLMYFDNSLDKFKRNRHAPYSQMDYYASRPRIRLSNPFEEPFVDNSDKTLWARSKQQTDLYYGQHIFRFEFPEDLFKQWDKLMAVFKRCGFTEPHPFGLKFSEDNVKTLAALYDTALNDEKNPNKWYEYNTSNDLPSNTTTQSYPTTLLA
jgi:hypothetical protein